MNLKLSINNNEFSVEKIAPIAMNFGQLQKAAGRETAVYSLVLDFTLFTAATQVFFKHLRNELIEELKDELENDFEELENYISIGCPDLPTMIEKQKGVLAGLIKFYDLEILNALQKNTKMGSESPDYLILTLDTVLVKEQVEMTGIAIKK